LANGLAFGLSEKYCLKELKILAGIALGDHGFGELFNQENPFYVISVGKEAKKLNVIARNTLREYRKRISFMYVWISPL